MLASLVAILLPWHTSALLSTNRHRQLQFELGHQRWWGRQVAVEQYDADAERPGDSCYAPVGFLRAKELVVDELKLDASEFQLLVEFGIGDDILPHCDENDLEAIGMRTASARKIAHAIIRAPPLSAGDSVDDVSPERLLSECSSMFEQRGLATWSPAEKSALMADDDAAAAGEEEEEAASRLLDAVFSPGGGDTSPQSVAGGNSAFNALRVEDVLQTVPSVLSPAECDVLRKLVDNQVEAELALDNLDDLPDFQVNVAGLRGLRACGLRPATVDAIERLPRRCFGKGEKKKKKKNDGKNEKDGEANGAAVVDDDEFDDVPRSWPLVTIFLRRYTPGTRPYLPWHTDTNAYTANVALSGPSEHSGGELRCVAARRVATCSRGMGDATVHGSGVLHAVSPVTSGVRYSMLCFFHDDATAANEDKFFRAQHALDDLHDGGV